ncbi:tetratricopeptide repeat protein [Desulfoprunum benzoelyticum]|uniref:Putative negative regulator of RcsB-dependent stress response n=1 Tax=Desulfoprunum benzoelyticum TaxID=1506996 RepID=A0A840UYA5_9BACT|nr:tetratricopeptide repeat protein [Desulfoprunum benzoelyticum]MBB5346470.1 putative negative regulator of RcsB-dependent stress response [Desulfoprunum benzoelyticum]MBM9529001.1 tetratricopeptide repeat protein [Desulfoprunum benzoelyticum]
MGGESVFDKKHVEPSAMGDVEGLLEHFNLPPAVISYIRRNKRVIQVTVAAILITVVALALYDSYRQKRIEEATSALTTAMQKAGDDKEKALGAVAAEFAGTASARWAEVELAHLTMAGSKFKEAAEQYRRIRNDLDRSDPLYALTSFGFAQAKEAGHEYDEASAAYQELKDIDGYQAIGYTGIARILESQGKTDKAIETLTTYLSTLADKAPTDPGKRIIEDRIARLKVKQ